MPSAIDTYMTFVDNIELNLPSLENPFGRLKLGLEFQFTHQEGKQYPKEGDEVDVVFSEKTMKIMDELQEAVIGDLINATSQL